VNVRRWFIAAVATACGIAGLLGADDGRIYFWSAFGALFGLLGVLVYLDWADEIAKGRK